jgi:hypothetical protein
MVDGTIQVLLICNDITGWILPNWHKTLLLYTWTNKMRYNIDQRAVQSLSSVKGIPLVHNINKCNQMWYLRFLMALTTKITVYWDVKACSLADKRKCATTRVNTYAAYSYQVLSKMYQITRHHIPKWQQPSLWLQYSKQTELGTWILAVHAIFMS